MPVEPPSGTTFGPVPVYPRCVKPIPYFFPEASVALPAIAANGCVWTPPAFEVRVVPIATTVHCWMPVTSKISGVTFMPDDAGSLSKNDHCVNVDGPKIG